MPNTKGLTPSQAFLKRLFDIVFSFVGLLLFGGFIFITFILASIDTRSNGFFIQNRVGRHGRLFSVIKLKTMCEVDGMDSMVTCKSDVRITPLGRFWRMTKIDELPQLINILLGDMSFVGPRPDVPGFADKLVGDDRIILSVRPGITGPATLKYSNEEEILENRDGPEEHNRDVLYPDKVNINKEYIYNYRFVEDIKYIIRTIFKHD